MGVDVPDIVGEVLSSTAEVVLGGVPPFFCAFLGLGFFRFELGCRYPLREFIFSQLYNL